MNSPVNTAADARCKDHREALATGTCLRCGSFLCSACVTVGRCEECLARQNQAEPRPIGGWLILPMLSLFAHPLLLLARVGLAVSQTMVAGGFGAVLQNDPGWLAATGFDLVFTATAAAWSVFTIPGFLGKQRVTIRRMQIFYVIVLVGNAVGTVIEAVMGNGEEPTRVTSNVMPLVIPVLWLSYFRSSKRVQETFVRD